VNEAGGSVVDLHLHPLKYNCKERLENPQFLVFGDSKHDWLDVIQKVGP
jgi:3'-phosphoadenosine 5'-phosphosulfate (PAPS) 3'-phosphatase